METEKLIIEIIADKLCLKIDEITPQASFVDDLGADSLDEIEILMSIEDEFNIEIPDEDAVKMRTVKKMIDYIKRKI